MAASKACGHRAAHHTCRHPMLSADGLAKPHRTGAAATLDPGSEEDRVARCAAVQQVPHPMPGLLSEFLARNGCGREGWGDIASKRDVVESHDRDVSWHVHASFAEGTHQTHRDEIVERQRAGRGGGEDALCSLVAAFKAD